jgi:hypothetical protein
VLGREEIQGGNQDPQMPDSVESHIRILFKGKENATAQAANVFTT